VRGMIDLQTDGASSDDRVGSSKVDLTLKGGAKSEQMNIRSKTARVSTTSQTLRIWGKGKGSPIMIALLQARDANIDVIREGLHS
jgi:hypothetical protein